jgi:FkbM family methyltransferase
VVALPFESTSTSRRVMMHTLRMASPLSNLMWRIVKRVVGGRLRIAPTFTGGRLLVDVADFIGGYIYYFGVWEPHLSALITSRLNAGDVFCDVGANIGYYTLLAAPIVGRSGKVVAIEPSGASFETLQRNVRLNAVNNVRMVNVAVSEKPDTLTLYSRRGNQGATTTLITRGFVPLERVSALPLGSILRPDEKDRLRLIKIDVEGAEGPIMQNLFETIDEYPETLEIVCEMSVSDKLAQSPSVNTLIERFALAGFRAFSVTNSYELSSYLSFKHPQAPEPIVAPVMAQQDIFFSRQFCQ